MFRVCGLIMENLWNTHEKSTEKMVFTSTVNFHFDLSSIFTSFFHGLLNSIFARYTPGVIALSPVSTGQTIKEIFLNKYNY